MLILDIFAENERYDVKQNAQPTTREHLWPTHDIQFHSENWIINLHVAGLFETMSFSEICFQ